MPGFLDKNTRIVDMVLTNEGKDLLARGELKFVYWATFDDEVDYDPFVSGSGLTRDLAIEESLVREATTGRSSPDKNGHDRTNVHRPMFDMPQGQTSLPEVTFPTASDLTIKIKQTRRDRDVVRSDPTTVNLEFGYLAGSFPADFTSDGFLVRIFKEEQDRLTQVEERRDLENRPVFGSDLVLRSGTP